jgi:hypothetical protein
MQEIWRDVKGYEGFYMVSNLGRVKSLDRYVSRGCRYPNKFQYVKGKILSPNKGGSYLQVVLNKGGKSKPFLVHRLVAEAFIDNPNNYPCVNHIDENKKNNCVDNLEWCTYKYNNEYNGRIEKCRDKIRNTLKGRPTNRTLTDTQRENIRQGAYRGWVPRRKNLSKEVIE